MRRPPWLLPLLLGLAAWLPSVWVGGFALDDRELLFENPVVDGRASWTAAFERDYFAFRGGTGQYRPLSAIDLRTSRSVFGERAWPWHLENVVLHLAALGFAAAVLARRVRGRAWVFGLCVFAVHPALADVVAWIAGRTSSLGAIVGLAGALAVVRAKSARGVLVASALGVLGASLAKEDGVLFAPLCALLAAGAPSREPEDFPHEAKIEVALRRRVGAALCGCAIAIALALAGRTAALGEALPRASSPALGDAALGERLVVGGHAWLEALRLALLPFDHPPRYTADFLLARWDPLPNGVAAALGWALAAALPLLAWCLRARLGRAAAWSSLFAVLALLPVVQIVPLGEVFAPRFLYLPLLFAIPLIGALHAAAPRPLRALGWLLVVLALVPLAWRRTTVYAGRASWHAEVLAHEPGDARSWNDLGLAREEEGDVAGARAAYERATELRPAYSRPWSNLGRLALAEGDEERALARFERAARVGPRNAVAHANLGAVRLRRDEPAEAEAAYRDAVALAPEMVEGWRGLARALRAQDRLAEADDALARALALAPDDPLANALRDAWHAADR